jgi:hypothetical protein
VKAAFVPAERPRVRRASPSLRWLGWLAGGIAGACGFALALGWAPGHADGGIACALREATGIACPTCGMTRATALLAGGEWAAAAATHPWALLLPAQAMAAWAAWGLWLAGRLAERPDHWTPRVVAANAIALAAWWGMRLIA